MRKIICALFLISLLISGCGSRTVPVSQISQDYLDDLSVKDSRILSCPWKEIEACKVTVEPDKSTEIDAQAASVNWRSVSQELKIIGDAVNLKISRINLRVLSGEGDDKEQALMAHYPRLRYDYDNNLAEVILVADDARAEEEAVRLFQEVVGYYEEIRYRFIKPEDFTQGVDY